MQRPFPSLGVGWLIALITLILAVLCALGAINLSPFWLVALLALAVLV